jgi:hypothetical protein
LDLADRKIYKQKNKRQQDLRKDEKKILYYKLNSMEIQFSSQIFKPVQCEELLNLADRKKQDITIYKPKKSSKLRGKTKRKSTTTNRILWRFYIPHEYSNQCNVRSA